MLTYTNAYTRAASMCGVAVADTTNITFIQNDINQALRLFKNAARRYWTRKEATTNMVAGQQYYQLPPDAVRITEVRVNSNGLNFPTIIVSSEHLWNKLNIIPAMTINLPTYCFVRGFNELGLWPTPSANTTNGLIVSYEPRLQDMSVDDVTSATTSASTVSATAGSATVTFSSSLATAQMVGRWFSVTDGTDGNWYQIGGFTSGTALTLVNYYAGISGSGHTFIIAQAPDIPEDYHMALPYYAAFNFYLKRKDTGTAEMYKGEFYALLDQYKRVYSAKQTGIIQSNIQDYRYSLFSLPPNPIS